MRSQKIDNNSDNEQDSKAQEALTAVLVNSSKISTRNSCTCRNIALHLQNIVKFSKYSIIIILNCQERAEVYIMQ